MGWNAGRMERISLGRIHIFCDIIFLKTCISIVRLRLSEEDPSGLCTKSWKDWAVYQLSSAPIYHLDGPFPLPGPLLSCSSIVVLFIILFLFLRFLVFLHSSLGGNVNKGTGDQSKRSKSKTQPLVPSSVCSGPDPNIRSSTDPNSTAGAPDSPALDLRSV